MSTVPLIELRRSRRRLSRIAGMLARLVARLLDRAGAAIARWLPLRVDVRADDLRSAERTPIAAIPR